VRLALRFARLPGLPALLLSCGELPKGGEEPISGDEAMMALLHLLPLPLGIGLLLLLPTPSQAWLLLLPTALPALLLLPPALLPLPAAAPPADLLPLAAAAPPPADLLPLGGAGGVLNTGRAYLRPLRMKPFSPMRRLPSTTRARPAARQRPPFQQRSQLVASLVCASHERLAVGAAGAALGC
jgi:hypothetical protein